MVSRKAVRARQKKTFASGPPKKPSKPKTSKKRRSY